MFFPGGDRALKARLLAGARRPYGQGERQPGGEKDCQHDSQARRSTMDASALPPRAALHVPGADERVGRYWRVRAGWPMAVRIGAIIIAERTLRSTASELRKASAMRLGDLQGAQVESRVGRSEWRNIHKARRTSARGAPAARPSAQHDGEMVVGRAARHLRHDKRLPLSGVVLQLTASIAQSSSGPFGSAAHLGQPVINQSQAGRRQRDDRRRTC